MIQGIFHKGSGLGNQLHRYVMTRVLAEEKGFEWGMIGWENFKGASFMKLDRGTDGYIDFPAEYVERRTNNPEGVDIRGYDFFGLSQVEDGTIIDGEFQGEGYYMHQLENIKNWLKVDPIYMPEDLCVINFRGGEYVGVRDLFLPQEYWDRAIEGMKAAYPYIRFEVHTDDPTTAHQFFPDFPVVANIEINWRSIRYAKHLIISNSSFAILPALLGDAKEIIAPMYWAGRNVGYWKMNQNKYQRFTYI